MTLSRNVPLPPFSHIGRNTTLSHLRQLHAHLLVSGYLSDATQYVHLITTLSLAYPENPLNLFYSTLLLTHFPHPPSLHSHNSLIRAHSKGPNPHLSFPLYRRLLHLSLIPDHFTFTFLIRSVTASGGNSSDTAATVHAAALRRGHTGDPHVQSGLVHMYSHLGLLAAARAVFSEIMTPDLVSTTAFLAVLTSAGEVDSARNVFDQMLQRDHVAWNAMIAGYVHAGRAREALELFVEMQAVGVCITEAAVVPVLTACAQLGALDQGKWVHLFVQKRQIPVSVTLGTALIDMYAKCGVVARAMEVFEGLPKRNVYTWTCAISGLAMNGAGRKCLKLFRRMEEEGVKPNGVTFVGVLRGCCVSGLVDEGRACFDSMRYEYGIEPWHEHYGCMVDLYGRAGRLNDAVEFINAMPIEPHNGAWGALLNACRIHKNVELGKHAMSNLVKIEAKNDAAHVLLSNIYAESQDWKGVSGVRELMKAKKVKKEPACSVMEVGGEVHEFFVGDKSHPRYKDIETMLTDMSQRLRLAGYIANTKEVLFDIEEEEKEVALSWHSEKLAIAFGLIALEEGTTIRIVKNLRVCQDCHDYTKLISKVFNREIVVRDRNRFHHFKDGVCSCMDYW